MPQLVFVTGGAGFVGRAILEELGSRGRQPLALIHRRALTGQAGAQSIQADLFDPPSLAHAMHGCDAVIHLVGIIMERPGKGVTFERMHVEATRSVLTAAQAAGVKRYLHMSALGTRPDAPSQYHKTKYRAEQLVQQSGLDWTIFRPALIHGPGGEFTRMEAAFARKHKPPFLFMPYFGKGLLGTGGAGRLQPVYVKDVARAFVDALENPRTIGEIYPLAGSQSVTWPELHRAFAKAVVGKNRLVAAMPVWVARLQVVLGIARLAGFNRDQIIMSQEDNTADLAKFRDHFGFEPSAFEAALSQYGPQL